MRRMAWSIVGTLIATVISTAASPAVHAATPPPFSGTVWLTPNILTPDSPTDYVGIASTGTGERRTFDRRTGWVTQNAYLFRADYSGAPSVEVIVDPEFGSVAAAQEQAARYARVVGQLPHACRTQVDALWIHAGDKDAGGGNRSLLIHTDYGSKNWPYIEEVLTHECAHTSLDSAWNGSVSADAWATAAATDPGFLSTYAADHPTGEDVAETFLPYVALRLDGGMAYSASQLATIRAQIANRAAYLDSLNLDLLPTVTGTAVAASTPSATTSTSKPAAKPRPKHPCAKPRIRGTEGLSTRGRHGCGTKPR